MKNIVEVREQLSEVFADLRAAKIGHHEAAEMNNCAGKILTSLKVELEYYALTKQVPSIPFFVAPALK